MIRRATLEDVENINSYIGRDFPDVDLTIFLSDPSHVCLLEGGSGAMFAWRGPRIYEVHVFFEVGGRAALDLGHRMMARMRADHGARLFWALVPVESRKVHVFTRLMGWKSEGVRPTDHGPCELYVSERLKCLQQ